MKNFDEMMETLYRASASTPAERRHLESTALMASLRLNRKESMEETVAFLQTEGISIDVETLIHIESVSYEQEDMRLLTEIISHLSLSKP